MKTQVNPVVAGVVIFLVVAALAAWIYRGNTHSYTEITDTGLPPAVAQRLKTQGPQPMPPMPMPGHNVLLNPGGAPIGRAAKR